MTEIMPVPRNLSFTVLPAGGFTHPFLGEKIEWGMVPYAQSMLLARFLRGDLDEYPPFLWK